MKQISFQSEHFPDEENKFTQVSDWQARYGRLLELLIEFGTEVSVSKTSAHNAYSPPKIFYQASHLFIFPPQKDRILTEETLTMVDSSPEFRTMKEVKFFSFNEPKVEGELELRYNDTEDRIDFSIIDTFGESQLPEELVAEIANVVENGVPKTSDAAVI